MESPLIFENAIWKAHGQLLIDFDEACKAIENYKLDYATMHRQALKPYEHNRF